ncbi:protein maelstrom homolog [Contarinia nasturtii]|uniref:protein maelstrom homolog n=1 Tax=Contarinia nasturtii TaxID=265458 RepID=UPI0012D498EA|nr:protein maelstrom homolog [Contarinia nasturtii]
MGKKKVKPNAFSVFMREVLERESRNGRKYPKEEWASVAKPLYDKLSASEKERYKQMAKQLPSRVVHQAPKFTSQGIPLEQVEREQRALEEKKRFMERSIKTQCENAFLDNVIKKKEFFFIMGNYFYKTMSAPFLYAPAEIAVSKFTFEDGITQKYQTAINPGTVAMGYAFEAQERSQKIHRLPTPPDALGEKNYENVYKSILDVLGVQIGETFDLNDNRRPSVYIRKQDMEMMESILDQLSENQWQNTFNLFELELLFHELKNKVTDVRVPISVTNSFIEQDKYDALANISCDHHEKEDATRHCALSCVQRWFYLFADHICEKIDVRLVPGTHLPINARLTPVQGFEDDLFNQPQTSNRDDDHRSVMSSSYTGYSRHTDSDSSSDDY